MKRILALVVVAMLCLAVFAGCADTTTTTTAAATTTTAGDTTAAADTTAATPSETSFTFGVSINSLDQYRTSWSDSFKAMAESRGHTVVATNADNNASTQISDIESLIQKSPDVILIHAVDSSAVVSALDSCEAANIPVIMIDMNADSENYTSWIMDPQGLNGVIQGEYLLDWLDADSSRVANVGYIVGMYSMPAAMPRMDDFKATIEGDSRVTWIADKEANWDGAAAMTITEDWLQAYPDMNVFACMSDQMAIGAIQALVAAGKDMSEVVVMGVDGSDLAKEYLRSGELACTAARDLNKEVTVALDTAEKIANGETVDRLISPEAIFPMTSADVQ